MSGIAAFLAARLDEREKQIREHLCIHCGQPVIPLRSAFGVTGYTHSGGWEGKRCPGRIRGAEPVQDPEGALREVAAKRAILEMHSADDHWCSPEPPDPDWVVYEAGERVVRTYPCGTLRHLAAVYSDHPDYDPDWAPRRS